MATDQALDLKDYPLWHGSAPMSFLAQTGGSSKLLVRGRGVWVEDVGGRRFIDARAGICNVLLGYGRVDIAEAMYQQALQLPFGCVIRYERPASITVEYARALVGHAPEGLTLARLTHTGTASTEAAQ